jgi:hypothetical protein
MLNNLSEQIRDCSGTRKIVRGKPPNTPIQI